MCTERDFMSRLLRHVHACFTLIRAHASSICCGQVDVLRRPVSSSCERLPAFQPGPIRCPAAVASSVGIGTSCLLRDAGTRCNFGVDPGSSDLA